MPHIFLHVRDGGPLVRDDEGELLPGVDAVRAEALELAHISTRWSSLRTCAAASWWRPSRRGSTP